MIYALLEMIVEQWLSYRVASIRKYKVYGRENAGQLFEITVSYICMKIIQYIQMNVLDVGECINMYLDLLKIAHIMYCMMILEMKQ